MTLPIFTKLAQIFGFKRAEGYCSICNIPLVLERDTSLTSTYVCPDCGYFKIKLKLFPPGKLPEAKPEKIPMVEVPAPVEVQLEEVKPKLEEIPIKPEIPIIAPPEEVPKVEKPEIEVPEKVEIKPEVEIPKPKKIKIKKEKIPKVEPKIKEIEKVAEFYKVPEDSVKRVFSEIEKIEEELLKKPAVEEIAKLRKNIEELEKTIREQGINVVPEVIEKLVETKARISALEAEKVEVSPTEARIRNKIKEIERRIEQIKEAKEVVKERYYKGEIDETSLRSMMENYEQKLIEAEVELKQWEKELEKLKEGGEVRLPEVPEVAPVVVKMPEVMKTRPEREEVVVKRILPEEVTRPPAKKLPLLPTLPEVKEERVVKELKVSDVMSRDVITVKPSDSLRTVAEILSENRIGGAPVVSEGKFVGIITEEDIFRAVGGDKGDLKKLEEINVASVMEKTPITIREDLSLSKASSLMKKHNIDRLPVLDKENRLIGIVTRSDVIRGISKQLIGEARVLTEEIKVETSIDEIIKIVNEAGSISIGEIAKRLKIKEERIEEWAKVLEEHNLLKLFYPAIGKPILRKVG